jgi:hypothetical protein
VCFGTKIILHSECYAFERNLGTLISQYGHPKTYSESTKFSLDTGTWRMQRQKSKSLVKLGDLSWRREERHFRHGTALYTLLAPPTLDTCNYISVCDTRRLLRLIDRKGVEHRKPAERRLTFGSDLFGRMSFSWLKCMKNHLFYNIGIPPFWYHKANSSIIDSFAEPTIYAQAALDNVRKQ